MAGQPFPKMKRVKQVSSSHCGPAVLEALFSFVGVKVSQRKIVDSLRFGNKIKKYGLGMREMARAAKVYSDKGKYVFWRKSSATIVDLDRIVNTYKYPVGVEWQGIFYEYSDEDNGHYSIVTKIDRQKGTMRLSDPFSEFAGTDRKLGIDDFKKRWWDTNMIGRRTLMDKKILFVITPKEETFPKKLGMLKAR